MKSSLAHRRKFHIKRLRALTGELALRGKLTLSSAIAKEVKRMFQKLMSWEKAGHYDRLMGRLFLTNKTLKLSKVSFPLISDKKIFSRYTSIRMGDSTRMMELKIAKA